MAGRDKGKGKTGRDLPDIGLWEAVVRTIKPLKHNQKAILPPRPDGPAARQDFVISPPVPPPRTPHAGFDAMDKATEKKLRQGKIPVERTIDLHGLTQEAAQRMLTESLLREYARGTRCVLVITGKGKGVLKQAVPDWLSRDPLKPIVLRAQKAIPPHGGDGALYVLLRRNRALL